MNAVQQRNHRTVTDTLDHRIQSLASDVETVVGALDARVQSIASGTAKAINDERTHRLKLAEEQRAYVDRADRINELRLTAFVQRGFWSRLNWLLTGR